MATPAVAAFTRAHFNCSSAVGAEIENNDGSCIGSHWYATLVSPNSVFTSVQPVGELTADSREERLFGPELMTPVVNYRNPTSALTLAFFEDTGWYQANFSVAAALMWGTIAGNATTGRVESIDADTYCSEDGEACAPNGLSRSWCFLKTDYEGSNIPPWYRYFSSPTTGGHSKFGDYCPVQDAYDRGDCLDQLNFEVIPHTEFTPFGEIYGQPNSRCTLSTLRLTDMFGYQYNARRAGCYPMTCSGETIQVSVQSVDGRVQTVQCTYNGEEVAVPGFTGSLKCPDPFVVCQLARCATPCGPKAMCVNGQCTPLVASSTAPSPIVTNLTTTLSLPPVVTTSPPRITTPAVVPASDMPRNTTSANGNNTIMTTLSPATTSKRSQTASPLVVSLLVWSVAAVCIPIA
ncbi:hypothetical protein H310_04202 [Aphanomyces invadans]|uniref:Leishmanolysin-like peptidase n=1 Tax=Aphanomyces invadans TaxID=157072 RepID=A0A024UG80_9STRA|nr:hypothetical protein H310_04202 [Aphanomyces invadans]ETW05215.1 hypothetical protein H310_04202 [Aphanomyces invadans]|eukprot:XP_008866653.1 hypothetical protein H310_04202 [Aphanomyces invadans]